MSPGDAGRRAAAIALAGYLLWAAVLLGPPLRGGRVFSFRDLADYAIPHKLFGVAELKSGRMPLWNPYNFFGFPHLANLQSGVLYPPNALLLLPFPLGLNLVLGLHFVLAALGARRLGLRLGLGAFPAALGGVAYGFSPYLLSLLDLNAFLFTSSWLPWLIAAGLELGRDPTRPRVAATAALFALGFLAGEPQTLAIGGLVAGLASLAGPREGGRRPARLLGAWVAAAVLSLLLVAPVLLPFLELARASERVGGGLSQAEVYQQSLEPEGLATLVLPGLAGDLTRGSHWLGSQTYVRSPYLGVGVLVLAVVGGVHLGRRGLALGALAGGGLLLALGPSGGLFPLLYSAGFRQSRFPVKFLVLTVLALALLAGHGAEALVRLDRRRALLALALAVAPLALLALVAMALPLPPGASGSANHALLAAVALILTGLPGRVAARQALLLLVMAADLAVAGRVLFTTATVAEVVGPPAVVERARLRLEPAPDPWPRTYAPPITAESLRFVYPRGAYDPESYERKKSLLFGNTNLLFRLPVVRGGESMEIRETSQVLALIDRGPEARAVLDLAGAGLFLTDGRLEGLGFELIHDGPVRLYRNPRASPHAFLVGRSRPAGGAEQLLAPDLDLTRTALVEADPGPLHGDCRGPVRVSRWAPDAIGLEAEPDGRCLLVVTDSWYPGWKVTVDGKPTALLRVNHAFRGVVLEGPGRRRVEMRYRPLSFALGLGLDAIGLLGLALLVRRGRASLAGGAA